MLTHVFTKPPAEKMCSLKKPALMCFAACQMLLWRARNDMVFNVKTTTLFTRIEEELKLWATRSLKNTEEISQWAMKFSNST